MLSNSPTSPILYGDNRPDFLKQETLADVIEHSMASYPQSIAIAMMGDESQAQQAITYAELAQRSAHVAQFLAQKGIGAGDIVGLWMPRGLDALVLQAGIARAGAAWLPFDEKVPVDRVMVCLEDAHSSLLLTHVVMQEMIDAYHVVQDHAIHQSSHVQIYTSEHISHAVFDELVPLRKAQGSDPAYVIYTSGSTGKPKGILINQASICHFLRSENSVLGVRHEDKVYQGFSLAFDMSFEEIWISYLVGAQLCIAPSQIAHDPEALPLALDKEKISVLHCVPTLLALFAQNVPSLRIINLGGEMCPESLIEKWTGFSRDANLPERQIFNTYGPTEATVSASLETCKRGAPITIGKPLPNYGLLVIDVDVEKGLNLLPRGEVGELCIFGPGVSDGYLGRPDLTAQKFLDNPWSISAQDSMIYRTGDLARIDADGKVLCLGRADDQVKIRGFRVELGEIEAVLAKQQSVGTVAVVLRDVDGMDQLVSFIVRQQDVPESENHNLIKEWRKQLSSVLPPYMLPSRYEMVEAMPRLSSGKIDRNTLKKQSLSPIKMHQESEPLGDEPQNPAQEILWAALRPLFPNQAITINSDFFTDLGGHSLMAARLVSALRQHEALAYFKISDIYQKRECGKIAEIIAQFLESSSHANDADTSVSVTSWQAPHVAQRYLCGLAQLATIPFLVALRMLQWLTPFFVYHFYTGEPDDSIGFAIALSVLSYLGVTVAEFLFAIAAKWMILGRLKPGQYRLWGFTYFRWWLSDRIIEAAPQYMLNGSSLYPLWLRALGAKVGNRVVIGSTTVRSHDNVHMEDGVCIGNASQLENVKVEHGYLKVGRIHLQQQSYMGSYCVCEGEVKLATLAHLQSQSSLSWGQNIAAQQIMQGSPAVQVGQFDAKQSPQSPAPSRLRQLLEAQYYALSCLIVLVIFFIPVFPTFILIDYLDTLNVIGLLEYEHDSITLQILSYFVLALPASLVLVVVTMMASAAIRWLCLPKLREGKYSVHSKAYYGKWFVNQIQESSLAYLHGVYATIFSPWWYRMLGAKVGKNSEISTVLGVVPDMLTLGDECFIADAVMLGDEELDQGYMSVSPTSVANRSFVGNGAFIPDGTHIPENVLIGVHTAAPSNERMKNGDTWIGSPPMHLPAREQVQGFPENLTFAPSLWRRCTRGLIEALRIIFPHALVIAVGYAIVLDLMPLAAEGKWLLVTYWLAISGLAYGLGCFIFVMLLKWLFIGCYKKSAYPMWTFFVWLSEGITNLYEGITVPNFMRYLKGTPWLPWAFRLMGAKIGKGVYMDTTDITEFDCVKIGDYAELNAACCPQTHLFEDRVMKIDDVVIGRKVNMGARSFVLYNAEVQEGVQLGPLSLVMKGESLPKHSRWHGCPAAVSRSNS